MFRTSTTFIKAQNPAASKAMLLDFYQQELEYQRVPNITVGEDAIYFRNRPLAFGGGRFGNQYFCFTSGKILIQDTDSEYQVFLEGDLSRIMGLGGALAGICGLAIVITVGFNAIAVALALIIFLLVSVVNYLYTLFFFPVYFTDLRNEMEESIQNIS
ncbi:hypothetical protein [Puia dinghuensis]|uniref:Uncharacterized protein n=1 Tax=Puia dinghuensis TaxID=1792502 RepID=A0A8J2UE61_9BACT|nr:hypothetical protein [Puia dinghuensis]GGB05246.1 hypothetical protein GCM10011511_30740 [Puia dinghuensis]